MIKSFRDKETEAIWNGALSKKFPKDIQRTARRKMIHIDSAKNLEDLKTPPGNRLHQLNDDRFGQHSISINMKYRICFNWNNGSVENVEIVDYH
ncbi:type II toxin-antitoxin system RelE/ParE family toxin [Leptospira meyeri]|uniref:type II toxin-antitoxin system RelE/ParE family toxin n=1 Tax=Leptospira meyeri TaxID=29508 RepID=UPI0010834F0C|nr:type II toxin-antitoxin system RelE/ParE family toxin [Leptospira meyeri]MCW7490933.1 type II toxin-antitoxin system RelE/ParE family toxin [Leptospira meyeri]TGM68644.1 type II toxin-antitoxin system RelE/ParE family toxin [Leptospira meyeri]TGM74352.1 type II toxin-antitoxin system RelE/ParE family toxin [Leptospira meyeri]